MDLSLAGYFSIIPFLLSFLCSSKTYQRILKIYSLVLLTISAGITIADIELYKAWKYRIEVSALDYLKNTDEATASMSTSPLMLLLVLFIGLISIFYYVYNFLFINEDNVQIKKKYIGFIIALFSAALMILPMRGGIGIAALNPGAVYFSNESFANHNAINPIWNFLYTAVNNKVNKNPFIYMDNATAKSYFNQMMGENASTQVKWIKQKNPNVLFIIWESFTAKVIDQKHDDVEITPGFNAWKNKGIYFSNAFASGDRTEKGLAAVLSGYPAQPITSIVKETAKAASLPNLSKTFKKSGYSSAFYYGGDLEFANMKAYLHNALFDKLISKTDFESSQLNSKWGAHDHFVFDKYLADNVGDRKTPFFDVVMTLTSHEPFETPIPKVILKEDETSKFLNSINYSDQSLDQFLLKASTLPWWKNTVVIVVADHGHRLPETNDRIEDFHIPILWTGGAIDTTINITKTVSQIDISKTLLSQLGLPSEDFNFAKNFNEVNNWAYFSYNNGFGIVDENCKMLFDNQSKKPSKMDGNCQELMIRGQSFLQISFENYLKAGKGGYQK
jgi:phosphoglycerol transferase MdoB-like AlkP superfamily enzyme